VACALCENLEAIRAANSRPADGLPGTENGSYSFSVYVDHPCGHEITQLDPYGVRSVVGKVFSPAPTEKFGTSTRAILRGLGYAEAAIETMLKSGQISESWSAEYLPS
jgi:crotonobetainyl-CoA:carnitine CoA-transferase CaiB-like acyl-CoA transferase